MPPLGRDVDIKCVGCSEPIQVLDEENSTIADIDAYKGGMVDSVVVGFGSKHDGSQFLLGICDNCIDRFIEDGCLVEF